MSCTITLRINRFLPTLSPATENAETQSKRLDIQTLQSSSCQRNIHQYHEHSDGVAWQEDYHIDVSPQASLLSVLLRIQREQDPTLSFRHACGHGMCGSDGVLVNGRARLLCATTVQQALDTANDTDNANPSQENGVSHNPHTSNHAKTTAFRKIGASAQSSNSHNPSDSVAPHNTVADNEHSHSVISLKPLPTFPVVKDLITDLDPLFKQTIRMKPWLHTDVTDQNAKSAYNTGKEHLQTPEELAWYEALTNCIMCGVCEGSCPIAINNHNFVGPAPLVAAMRFIYDSRDTLTNERLNSINNSDALWACKGLRECTKQCPRGIDIAGNLWKTMQTIRKNSAQ